MSYDINSLKQAALTIPLDSAELEPATSFINGIMAIQAGQAESLLLRISNDTTEAEHLRMRASVALEEIEAARKNM